MAQDTPSRDLDKIIVRLPDGMRDRLKKAAEENSRSVNAEVVYRLQTTLDMDDYQPVENIETDLQPGGLFGLAPAVLDDDTKVLLQAMELYAKKRREKGE